MFNVDPYALRSRVLDERLEPYEIGRILYHLAQRRGFLSNRRSDRTKDSDSGVVLTGISELRTAMDEFSSRTVGEYFALIHNQGKRVRKHYTHRSMYEDEFEKIWEAQRAYHPNLLTDELKYGSIKRQAYPETPDRNRRRSNETHLERYGLHGIIFFQRRTYWPVSAIGHCDLEPRLPRCPRADRLAQRFRIYQDINNVRYRDPVTGKEHSLDDAQRHSLAGYLMGAATRSFDQVRKHLAKAGVPPEAEFNFERGGKAKLKGNETDAALSSSKCLGKKRCQAMDEAERDRIIATLTTESLTDLEMLDALQRDCGLSLDEAALVLKANIPEGHVNLSRLAMEKLLPWVEQGLQLMGTDATNSALYAAGYLPLDVDTAGGPHLCPVPGGITNPIVRQALYEVRKVINAIIREYGRPGRIRIELAREAKKSFAERRKILSENINRSREREAAAERLREDAGIDQPKRNDILKYRLWEEAGGICVYCGKPIGIAQLSNGEANIDHILPRWRSLDDSYMNKVTCHRTCNADKGDRTPCEWLEESDPQRYHLVLDLAARLPYSKRGRFTQRDLVLTDFVNRHLSDTTYISRQVKDYLQSLGIPVDSSRGTITAELRRSWGLNTILYPEGQGEKTRNDHRHHAVDASVVALATPARLQQLARARGGRDNKTMPPPWEGFRDDLAASVAAIYVSHKPRRKLSGSLHEDTFFGPTQKRDEESRVPIEERPWARNWQEGDNLYVRRKPVSEITGAKHLAKVRDEAIRKILAEHLRGQGIDPEAQSYPKDAFTKAEPAMPSGVPVRKVRWVESKVTLRPAGKRREYQYVQPGSNHHICYYAGGSEQKPKWNYRVVPMWDAVTRVRRDGLPPVDRADAPEGKFIMSLSIGEAFLIKDEEEIERLCILRKIDGTGRIHYRLHTDARKAGELTKENLYLSPEGMRQRQARKVTVGAMGQLRWSGD